MNVVRSLKAPLAVALSEFSPYVAILFVDDTSVRMFFATRTLDYGVNTLVSVRTPRSAALVASRGNQLICKQSEALLPFWPLQRQSQDEDLASAAFRSRVDGRGCRLCAGREDGRGDAPSPGNNNSQACPVSPKQQQQFDRRNPPPTDSSLRSDSEPGPTSQQPVHSHH